MMKPIAVQELLWRKEGLTIQEAAILLLGEGQSSVLGVAETELKNAIHSGALNTFFGYSGTTPPYTRHEYIHMGDFKLFFQSLNAEIKLAASAPSEMETPISITQQQDKVILNWLKDKKYDPQELPKRVEGKPWVKRDCRVAVCSNMQIFSSSSVFDTAWDRLRKSGEIKEGK